MRRTGLAKTDLQVGLDESCFVSGSKESYELSKAWASVLTGGRGDIPFAAVFGRARVLVSLALDYLDFLPPV